MESRDQLLAVSTFASTRPADATTTADSADSADSASADADTADFGTTIAEYVERMVEGQEEIYYLTGTSRAAVENSPHLEAFRARGVEVLILTDPVDEVWVDAVGEVDGKRLRSVAKGDVDLSGIGSDTRTPPTSRMPPSSRTCSPGSARSWRTRSSRCGCRTGSPSRRPAWSVTSSI